MKGKFINNNSEFLQKYLHVILLLLLFASMQFQYHRIEVPLPLSSQRSLYHQFRTINTQELLYGTTYTFFFPNPTILKMTRSLGSSQLCLQLLATALKFIQRFFRLDHFIRPVGFFRFCKYMLPRSNLIGRFQSSDPN